MSQLIQIQHFINNALVDTETYPLDEVFPCGFDPSKDNSDTLDAFSEQCRLHNNHYSIDIQEGENGVVTPDTPIRFFLQSGQVEYIENFTASDFGFEPNDSRENYSANYGSFDDYLYGELCDWRNEHLSVNWKIVDEAPSLDTPFTDYQPLICDLAKIGIDTGIADNNEVLCFSHVDTSKLRAIPVFKKTHILRDYLAQHLGQSIHPVTQRFCHELHLFMSAPVGYEPNELEQALPLALAYLQKPEAESLSSSPF